MEVMESDVLSQTVSRNSRDNPQGSETRQHSRNSLSSAAGAALRPTTTEEVTKIMSNTDLQEKPSEYSEALRNSLSSEVDVAARPVTTEMMIENYVDRDPQRKKSEDSEESLNSWVLRGSLKTIEDKNNLSGKSVNSA